MATSVVVPVIAPSWMLPKAFPQPQGVVWQAQMGARAAAWRSKMVLLDAARGYRELTMSMVMFPSLLHQSLFPIAPTQN
jgi:hypothetical protein